MTSKLIRNLEELPLTSYINNYYQAQLGNNTAREQSCWQLAEIWKVIDGIDDERQRQRLKKQIRAIESGLFFFVQELQTVIQQEKDKPDEN